MAVEFKEIGRVKASEATELVVSKVVDGTTVKGLNLNTYIVTDKYKGFTKGVFIPAAAVKAYAKLIALGGDK